MIPVVTVVLEGVKKDLKMPPARLPPWNESHGMRPCARRLEQVGLPENAKALELSSKASIARETRC